MVPAQERRPVVHRPRAISLRGSHVLLQRTQALLQLPHKGLQLRMLPSCCPCRHHAPRPKCRCCKLRARLPSALVLVVLLLRLLLLPLLRRQWRLLLLLLLLLLLAIFQASRQLLRWLA